MFLGWLHWRRVTSAKATGHRSSAIEKLKTEAEAATWAWTDGQQVGALRGKQPRQHILPMQ